MVVAVSIVTTDIVAYEHSSGRLAYGLAGRAVAYRDDGRPVNVGDVWEEVGNVELSELPDSVRPEIAQQIERELCKLAREAAERAERARKEAAYRAWLQSAEAKRHAEQQQQLDRILRALLRMLRI